MTKNEFDFLFLDQTVCIHHNTYEQWETIAQYLVDELGLLPASSVKNHDFGTYPYTHLYHGTVFANMSSPRGYRVLTFEQFCDAVTSDESKFQCSLEDVL